jgi:exodeoxyribonuclease VII large subunit
MPASYSLYELNEYIRRVVALNFTEPIWVSCEISQVKEVRGNVYLDLVHHDDKSKEITAQISANIWYKSFLFLKNKLGELLPSLLKEGTHVLIKVQVDFNERYGMKLVIEDIDPAFTIGQMEMNRQKIIQRLTDEGLMGLNKYKKLPSVVSKIAIISSETAAGYIDFMSHIRDNSYGYAIQTTLFNAALQGQNTERDVCSVFDQIAERTEEFDCILIIRGGGSKLDLSGFDSYNIGAKIGKCAIPVITGIGHDIDSTVADISAFQSLKTPTAVADFIIEHNFIFETRVVETTYWIAQIGRQVFRQKEMALVQTMQILRILPTEILKQQNVNVSNIQLQIHQSIKQLLRHQAQKLELADEKISLLNPKNILQRGYAIVRQDGKVVKKAVDINTNNSINIEFFDNDININPS